MSSRSTPYLTSLLIPALLAVLFGLFLHQIRWLSFISLGVCFMLLLIRIWSMSFTEIRQVFGFHGCRWHWILKGVIFGIGLAMVLRWYQTHTLYPCPLHPFLMIAVMVGLTEELLFRGYFFGHLHQWQGATTAIMTSALLHTAYKVALFISSTQTDELLFLGSLTFCAGLLLGHWRKASGSIWPCIFFHALFDLWVYGDRTTPWWVW